jgi:hypothetical protein
MMLGKHNTEVANVSGLGRLKNISNPLACRIVDSPHVAKLPEIQTRSLVNSDGVPPS